MNRVNPNHHLIESGDQPHEDTAVCKAEGCGFRIKHPDRNVRMAASYRHIADLLDPPKEKNA